MFLSQARLVTAALVAALVVTACTSFGPDTPAARHALDPMHDDVAGLLFAFDLPRGIGPLPAASTLSLAVPNVRPVSAALEPADAEQLASRLPRPANGRAYYFFAVARAGQAAIRAAQAAVRTASLDPSAAVLSVVPALCASGSVDPAALSVTVWAANASGPPLAPLIDHRRVSEIIGPSGKLPACP